MSDLQKRLQEIVRARGDLMAYLRAVRSIDPPDWLIAAGAIRSAVWDRLHGYEAPTKVPDVDVVFFDPRDLSKEAEKKTERLLRTMQPEVHWQVKNQAAVHLWFEKKFGLRIEPLTSVQDALARWSETATSVGVRLSPDDSIQVVAPWGLEDLFGLVWRKIPGAVTDELFRERFHEKSIAKTWPSVRLIDPDAVDPE